MSGEDDGNTFCVLIGYPRGQDGPFLLTRVCPFVLIQWKKFFLTFNKCLPSLINQGNCQFASLFLTFFNKPALSHGS